MNKCAIYHKVDGVYGYQLENNDFQIRIRVARNDVKKIEVIFGDPFNWIFNKEKNTSYWEPQGNKKLVLSGTDNDFDYFETNIHVFNKRFKYYFKITGNDDSEIAFGELGHQEWSDKINGHELGFSWGYSCKGKVNSSPDWWRKTDWYQVFPDSFHNPNKELKPVAGGTFKDGSSLGGNLKGIINKLDYINELGFKGLYLNPIFKATSPHKYDTIDYMLIDPQFGTLEDFKLLIEECHKRGMKIMIDGVFNHSGFQFEPWKDVLKNKEKSKYKDWFWINDFNNLKKPRDYKEGDFSKSKPFESFGNTPTMPRLNWENKKLKAYIKKVVEYWTDLGIDAWRLDVADEPSFTFWRFFRSVVKTRNPECVIMGEVWYDAFPFLQGDMFDSSMNYPFRNNVISFVVEGKITAQEFKKNIMRQKYSASHYVNAGLFTLLGSHDTPRVTSLAKGKKRLVRSAFALMFLMPGSISFYYGDEYCQVGKDEKDNRFPMDFSDHSKEETFILVKKLNKIRKKYIDEIQKGIIWDDIDSDKLEFHLLDGTTFSIDIETEIIQVNNVAI